MSDYDDEQKASFFSTRPEKGGTMARPRADAPGAHIGFVVGTTFYDYAMLSAEQTRHLRDTLTAILGNEDGEVRAETLRDADRRERAAKPSGDEPLREALRVLVKDLEWAHACALGREPGWKHAADAIRALLDEAEAGNGE